MSGLAVESAAPSGRAAIERDGPDRLRVRGPLTFATAARVWKQGERELDACDARQIAIDCSGIDAADSAALAVLVEWLAWAHRRGRTVRLTGVPQTLMDIARISELEDLIRPE